MKIALYLRVSTDVQDFNRQKVDLTAKINNEGNTITHIFSDKISGFKDDKDRPDLNNLLKLTKDDIDAVYITELSRLSRNPTYLRVLLDMFNEKGINVYSLTQNLNSLNSEGKPEFTTDMMISMLSQYSAYEVKLKNQRVESGKKDAIFTKGNSYTVKPAFGYTKVDKKLVIEPTEAEIVKNLFTKYATGTGTSDLIQYMNLNGIPTRNTSFIKKSTFKVNSTKTIDKVDIKWGKSSIKAILHNTVYCGYKIYNGENRIETPAIISEELFLKVQSELSKRRTSGDKSKRHEYNLRGIFICGECGKQMLGYRDLGYKNHPDLIYRCADKTHKKLLSYVGCTNASIFKSYAEDLVWNSVKAEYRIMKNKQVREGNITVMNSRIAECDSQIKLIDSRMKGLDAESDKMVQLYIKGLFADSKLDKEQKLINTELESLRKTKIKLQVQVADSQTTIKAIENMDYNPVTLASETALQAEGFNKEAVHQLLKEVLIFKIDDRFSVFQLNFKTGVIKYVIRETWLKNLQRINGSQFTFNPETKTFTSLGFNDSMTKPEYQYCEAGVEYSPVELFRNEERLNEITDRFLAVK